MKITVFSHFFRVDDFDKAAYFDFVRPFAFQYTEYDYRLVMIAKRRREPPPKPTIKKIYASFYESKRVFHFHRNTLEAFSELLRSKNYENYDIEYIDLYEPKKFELEVLARYVSKDDQVPLIDYLVADGTMKMLNLQTGRGKELRNSEKILTPTGWTTHGEIAVGDQVICPDGSVSNVTGVFPQGYKDIYRIYFYDGRFIDAGAEHLWKVYYVNTVPHQRWKVVNTLEIMRMMNMPNPRVYLPLIEPYGVSADVPLDSYLVGVLLGDGALTGTGYTICKSDQDVLDRCAIPLDVLGYRLIGRSHKEFGIVRKPDLIMRRVNPLKEILKSLNMDGKRSWEKEIPEVYMSASVEVKTSLLQGLLDTDGFASKDGSITFTSTSKRMAKQVQELVWSLGGIATITPKQKYFSHNGEYKAGRESYNVGIKIKNPSRYFHLTRKKERMNDENQYADRLKLAVRRVDKLPEQDLMTCISIDHPEHLYITTNYVVTHNTYCALKAASIIGGRVLISIPTRFFNLWMEALGAGEKQVLDLKDEEVLFVQGSKDLRMMMDMAIADQLDGIKVIVVASRTMELYIEAYERTNGDLDGLYPLDPNQLYPVLDIATRIKDELHLYLATNYKEELHLHCPKSISLSATLEDGSFRDKIFQIMFPKEMRSPETEYLRYIDVVALMYTLKDKDKVRYSHRGSNDYNHIAYEQYILKNRPIWFGYFKLIKEWVDYAFLSCRQPGMRAAIFADSVEMATEIMDSLKDVYPDVDIRRYAASTGDDYHYAREADILVTTVKSFGTGFDVENLFVVLMTTALRSQNTNVQVLGRLRPLKNYVGISPVFYYLTCVDIIKHMTYHEVKKTQFYGKVQSHKSRFLNNTI